jgi:hypothetical protein
MIQSQNHCINFANCIGLTLSQNNSGKKVGEIFQFLQVLIVVSHRVA